MSLRERTTPHHTLTAACEPRFGPLFALREAALSGPPDVTLRHMFPPDWSRPEAGKLIVDLSWEYGHLPVDWVRGAKECAGEIWVHSRFVRDIYVRSGVPFEKVRIVPHGVRPDVFSPDGPRFPLNTEKRCRFLFVGGAIARKGADLALQAYLRAFTAGDDVCLVVKAMGGNSFYRHQNFAAQFRAAAENPGAPQVIYLEDDLSEEELAALYRSCTALLLPYRAEGFALSPLEGMASGLVTAVTAGGSTEDYVDDDCALRIPSRRRCLGTNRAGPFECAGDPWNLEPDPDGIVDAVRRVYANPEQSRERGAAGRRRVEQGWTWERAVAIARERLMMVVAPPGPAPEMESRRYTKHRGSAKGEQKRASVTWERPDISLCMIVKDEEPNIRECLESIGPHVGEMVVVDTGSTDRTPEIAAKCGARVYVGEWPNSFAKARNETLRQATGQFIVWTDADDVWEPDSAQMLRAIVRKQKDGNAAFHAQVIIPPRPGQHGQSVVDHIKLFPNRPDVRFEHRIHEQILPSLRRAGIPIYWSEIKIHHRNYDRSAEGQERKRRRDFPLLDLDLLDNPDHPFTLFNFGMTYLYTTHDYEVAAQALRRCLAGSSPQDSIVRKCYAMLTQSRCLLEEWQAAMAVNEEGRAIYPDDEELLFQAGQIYQQTGRFAEARDALERLVSGVDEPHYRSVDTGLRTFRGKHELAMLYRRLGSELHCAEVLTNILSEYPNYEPARLALDDK